MPGGKFPADWDPYAAPGLVPDPSYVQPNIFGNSTPVSPGGSGQSICPQKRARATICDPRLRTININAPCGSLTDYYYYSPWRAPGSAPVLDPCGAAGGRRPGQGNGGAGAAYANTTHAKLADLGTTLPPRPSGTVFESNSVVEVAFTTSAFHGGGYSCKNGTVFPVQPNWLTKRRHRADRLCPAKGKITEECFQRTPLDFAGKSSLRWGGVGGERLYFDATVTKEGTVPAGSAWAKHPVRSPTRKPLSDAPSGGSSSSGSRTGAA